MKPSNILHNMDVSSLDGNCPGMIFFLFYKWVSPLPPSIAWVFFLLLEIFQTVYGVVYIARWQVL